MNCVDISVMPHYIPSDNHQELLELSKKYVIYGLCDEGAVIVKNGQVNLYGDVYKISNGATKKVH